MIADKPIAACDSVDAMVELSPASFARLARYVTGELGIKMPDSKAPLVQSRLLRRVRELGLGSIERYLEYFFDASHHEEREHLVNAITTNKTDFFREPAHFEFLTGTVLPSLSRHPSGPRARFQAWSAGCSSGEEPYTIAMVLSEYGAGRPDFDFAILGTDISTRVLKTAVSAIYRQSQILTVPHNLRAKYLLRSRDGARDLVRVMPELRRRVSFHPLNFMDDDYGIRDRFDAIFFRNVMIYFDKATQEAVINKICRNLAPGGYLFAGHSESITGLNIPVVPVKTSIYRKPA